MTAQSSTAAVIEATEEHSIFRVLNHPLLHIGILIGAIASVFLYTVSIMREMAGCVQFAMDDAWIHLSIARNFVDGHSWGMVPGKFLSLSTSPTWTILVGLAYLIYPDPIKSTLIFSVGCMCAAAILLYLLGSKLTGHKLLALLGSLIFILDPVSLWGLSSGMELPLSALSLITVLYLYYLYEPSSKMRRVGVPIALGFAAITRPELFVLIPLLIADTWWRLSHGSKDEKGLAVRTATTQAVIVGLTLLPYFALNLASHGMLFPTTYYAKTSVRGVGLASSLSSGSMQRILSSLIDDGRAQVFKIAQATFGYNPLVLLLILPGILLFTKQFRNQFTSRGLLLPLTTFILPYVMGISSPASTLANHANRYFVLFPPLTALLAVMGLAFFWNQARARTLVYLLTLGLVLAPTRTTYAPLRHLGIDADSTQKLYVESSKWINENIPEGAVLAVNDIGTLAYFTKRDMIDVMGLGTLDIWPTLMRSKPGPVNATKLREYLKEKKVEYLMLSPKYYPDLTKDSKTFEPIAKWSETYEKEHGRMISPQVMYKVHWE